MNAKMREKLMKLDERADRLGRGEFTEDWRVPACQSYTRYIWRGPITGKLYRLDVNSSAPFRQ